jgi:predicted AlkP superfamily pyrophosphatase or phosphodiesterase
MQKPLLFFAAIAIFFSVASQSTVPRPKLVVGIVVDQMRWDYLYRYYDRYAANGGFKKLMNQGFSCENTLISYTPSLTACGHAGIYTGSVPAIHGITGNNWWDKQRNNNMYCTQDDSVKTVGSTNELGKMSPKNLLVTTITDELRLATNFKSKVIGVALKDRGSILPAGHTANAAYWYDNKTGNWISSTYYMDDLPQWAKDVNAKKMVDKYYEEGWNTLYPINTYTQSTEDERPYENKPFGAKFPYDLKQFAGKNYGIISSTPQGATFTLDMAKSALMGEQLGQHDATDFLAISLSSSDYIGHAFGPNSIEAEDGFLRLDKDLGDFLNYLNEKIGEGKYLLFLSADHGAANAPGFSKEHHIPAGNLITQTIFTDLNKLLKDKYRVDGLVADIANYQVFLDHNSMASKKLNEQEVQKTVIDYLLSQTGVDRAFALESLSGTTLPSRIKEMISNGYYPNRSGDIQFILQPQWLEGFEKGGTTHGLWNPYDTHIPLLFYGWHINPGKSNRDISISDIAPTLAALLHIQMPSGNIGKVIEEVVK